MRHELPAIRAMGAEVVVIGSGQPFMAKAFAEDAKVAVEYLCDTDRVAYRAAGFKRSQGGVLNPKSLVHAVRAWRSGARQTRIQGDGLQLGGVLVVHPDGAVTWSYVSDEAGDHPAPSAITAALREAVERAG